MFKKRFLFIVFLFLTIQPSFSEVYIGAKIANKFGQKDGFFSQSSERFRWSRSNDFGFLAGYVFPLPFSPFVEIDILLKRKHFESKKEKNGVVEKINMKEKFEIAVMPGFQINVIPLINIIGGLRFGLAKYKLDVLNSPDVSNSFTNISRSPYKLLIEPTMGVQVNFTPSFSGRLSLGYCYVPSQKLIHKYKGAVSQLNGLTMNDDLKNNLSGWKASLSLLMSF